MGVYVRFLEGKPKRQLPWPFRGYIIIHLIDQLDNKNYYDRKIVYDETTDNVFDPLKAGSTESKGFGLPCFIALDDLYGRYILDDKLEFMVQRIVY